MEAEQTYLVMQWPHPVFQHPSADVVIAHLDTLVPVQQKGRTVAPTPIDDQHQVA